MEHLVLRLDALGPAHLRKVVGDAGRRDIAEVEPLTSALDRRRHLLGLGRTEDELDMLGRLLHRFEERVEGRRREHVDLVDDVDLEGPAHRAIDAVGDEVSGLLDGAVAGRVDLDDILILAGHDRLADLFGHVGVVGSVDGAGEDAGHGSFADTPGAAEEVGVGDTARVDGIFECAGDGLLADDLVEGVGPVPARKCGVAHRASVRGLWGGSLHRPRRRPGHRRHRMTAAYGCCGQALTRFTGHPCTGPGRLRERRREGKDTPGGWSRTLWHGIDPRTLPNRSRPRRS